MIYKPPPFLKQMYGNLQMLPSPTNDPTTENRNSHQFFQFPRCTPSSFDMTNCIVLKYLGTLCEFSALFKADTRLQTS